MAPRSNKSHTPNDTYKGLGHTLNECWKLGGGRQGQYPPWWKGKHDTPVPSSANLAIYNVASSDAGSVYTNKTVLVVNNAIQGFIDNSILYRDSGASTHFIQNRECFFHYMPLGKTSGSSLMFSVMASGKWTRGWQ
ncbi:hypothetical protein ARMGADRAFT_937741 [Armillaria gallica]|uniref:Uncharacterized protein n=1 Tax=Armillaria gallica TaxID=47427 RepID=A0A2H3D260_ARMGA|nr:hypothetical protein ARMGADRAFT_937741 [Armillaria gallica]